jgi:NAD(P)-dependent dehydrogenase (short-subunit alcohol dehydrogenase family)
MAVAEETVLGASRRFFRGRTLLVTGASSGIGYDVALMLAGLGAKTALLARRGAPLEELANKIRNQGGNALVLTADVTRRDQVRDAIRKGLEHFGHVDMLVNSAGVLAPGPVETMEPRDLQRMLDVNLLGTVHTMQALLPSMRQAGSGAIVNIASLAGRRGMPPLGGYCATKFALVGLTEALRVELYRTGVRVSLVMPGVVATPMLKGGAEPRRSGGVVEAMPRMPVRWVTWAVIAALMLGWAEIDVPPGAALAEKLAALFPGFTDAALAVGNRLFGWVASRRQ